jgi:uncharacterized membrane protein
MYLRVLIGLIGLIIPLTIWLAHEYLFPSVLLSLQLYPLLMNVIMLLLFSYTLLFPPSFAERIARLSEPDLPAVAVLYTRRVTQVWCLFFILNGSISLITTLWATPAVWSLYNGVIAYIMMGLLFGGEYLIRLRFRRRHHV